MKTLAIDESAHEILMKAKNETKKSGIDKPSHSDAIRWMWTKATEEQQ